VKSSFGKAIALMAFGWYLMLPPWPNGFTGPPEYKAPFSSWYIYYSSDSAKDCELVRADNLLSKRRKAEKGWVLIPKVFWEASECIASDDPRLKCP